MSLASHFKPRSLLFYGTLIGSVMTLFWIITRYGEANLTAPPNLSGRYVVLAGRSPCPTANALVLTLQQSGVFLNGSFTLETANPATAQAVPEYRSTLSGRWTDSQIYLSGAAPALAVCHGNTTLNAVEPVVVTGTIATGSPAKLVGKIDVGTDVWTFTAQREAIAQTAIEH